MIFYVGGPAQDMADGNFQNIHFKSVFLVALFVLSLWSPALSVETPADDLQSQPIIAQSAPYALESGYGHDLASTAIDVDGLVAFCSERVGTKAPTPAVPQANDTCLATPWWERTSRVPDLLPLPAHGTIVSTKTHHLWHAPASLTEVLTQGLQLAKRTPRPLRVVGSRAAAAFTRSLAREWQVDVSCVIV